MFVKDILENDVFTLLNNPSDIDREVSGIFSCDLLSHVIANAQEDNLLITILNNINVLGVASLIDLSCVVFAHNVKPQQEIIERANNLGIILLGSNKSTSETTVLLHKLGVKL